MYLASPLVIHHMLVDMRLRGSALLKMRLAGISLSEEVLSSKDDPSDAEKSCNVDHFIAAQTWSLPPVMKKIQI